MKVKELIEELQKMDPELPVYIPVSDDFGDEVSEIYENVEYIANPNKERYGRAKSIKIKVVTLGAC